MPEINAHKHTSSIRIQTMPKTQLARIVLGLIAFTSFTGCINIVNPVVVTSKDPDSLRVLLLPKSKNLLDTSGKNHVVKRAMIVRHKETLGETVEMYFHDNTIATFPRSAFSCVPPSGTSESLVAQLNRNLSRSADPDSYRSVSFTCSPASEDLTKCELQLTVPSGKKILNSYNVHDDHVVLPKN